MWGALRGLETLSALAGEACTVETAPVEVADAPRFGYRGLMVDSARHFLPVAFLEHVVDAMVRNPSHAGGTLLPAYTPEHSAPCTF